MATTNVMNSTVGVISVDGTQIADLIDATVNVTIEIRDVTNKDSAGWAEHLEGLRRWTMSGTAHYIPDSNSEALWDTITARSQVTATFTSTESGDNAYSGQAWVDSWSINSPAAEDNVTVEFSLTGTGALAQAAVT